MSLGQTSNFGSNLYFTSIRFSFLEGKLLFLYSLYDQHSADPPFHITYYQCRLQLVKFSTYVAWMDSITFAMFCCILYHKSLLLVLVN